MRELRERRVGTQTDLAKLVGVSEFTINRWENGKAQPYAGNYVKLTEVLKCTSDELMTEQKAS